MAEKIKVDIEATGADEASKDIEGVSKAAKHLEDLKKIKVEVDAEIAKAEAGLEDVEDAAKAVDKLDPDIDVTVDTGTAESNLKGLADQAERTDHSMRGMEAGSKVGGNAVADLAGPLGAAEGAASTAGGVFDGLGDIVEGLGPKFGLSEAAAQNMATALGLAGLAVAAGTVLWTKYQEEQAKARAETKKMAEATKTMNEALAAGDIDAATAAFGEGFGSMATIAKNLGIEIGDVFDFITGKAETLGGRTIESIGNMGIAGRAQAEILEKQRGTWEETTKAEAEAAKVTDVLTKSLEGHVDAARASEDAQDTLNDTMRASGDAVFAAQDAWEDFTGAVQDTTEATNEVTEAQKNYDESATPENAKALADAQENLAGATRSERDAAIEAATSAQDLAEKQAAANGVAISAEEKQNALNASLIESARHATPEARAQIEQYILTVNDVPPEKATEFQALIDQGKYKEAQALLDGLSADRQTTIDVLVTGIDKAKALLGFGTKAGQYGLDTTVTHPTTFIAGEHSFPERVQITPSGSAGLAVVGAGVSAGPAQSFNYNINLPRGTRSDDLLRTMRNHARRNGGRPNF